jgi:two-component system LytT family response regulator
MPRALVIDDEPPARQEMRRLLAAGHPDVSIVGEAGRIADAVLALARPDYDLVFLDVQLRGGTGFDLVPQIRPQARIIFVTGHDQYALRAFEVNALDYLLKPVEPARLAESLRRLTNPEHRRAPESPTWRPVALRLDDTTFLKTDTDAARFVRLRDILVIFSNENYTELWLADRTKIFVRRTLKAWADQLPPADFMRVHRTVLVNLHAVVRGVHFNRRTTHLFLQGLPEDKPVRARREDWPEIELRLAALPRQR